MKTMKKIHILIAFLSSLMVAADTFTLDMADESVDEDFDNCGNAKTEILMLKKLEVELKNVWEKVEKAFEKSDIYESAIWVYTDHVNGIYDDLNKLMRSNRLSYPKGFKYEALHYLITCGIQKLQVKTCIKTFRRTGSEVTISGNYIRFGSFTSSSRSYNLEKFGKKSCFEIETCFGADIAHLSAFPEEEEVLIPPYEVFQIMGTLKDSICDVVYILKSTGIKLSNLKKFRLKLNKP